MPVTLSSTVDATPTYSPEKGFQLARITAIEVDARGVRKSRFERFRKLFRRRASRGVSRSSRASMDEDLQQPRGTSERFVERENQSHAQQQTGSGEARGGEGPLLSRVRGGSPSDSSDSSVSARTSREQPEGMKGHGDDVLWASARVSIGSGGLLSIGPVNTQAARPVSRGQEQGTYSIGGPVDTKAARGASLKGHANASAAAAAYAPAPEGANLGEALVIHSQRALAAINTIFGGSPIRADDIQLRKPSGSQSRGSASKVPKSKAPRGEAPAPAPPTVIESDATPERRNLDDVFASTNSDQPLDWRGIVPREKDRASEVSC